MNEKLIIRDFAGIKGIELDIDKINILIGQQATGKSICAKLIFFFKNIFVYMSESISESENRKNFHNKIANKFEYYFPPSNWSENVFFLSYQIGNLSITIEKKQSKGKSLKISCSEHFKNLWNKSKVHYQDTITKDNKDDLFKSRNPEYHLKNYIYEILRNDYNEILSSNQIFIPAGRSFFAILQKSIFSFLSSNKALDPFLAEFGSFYENIKNLSFQSRLNNKEEKNNFEIIKNIINKILFGEYYREKDTEYLKMNDGRKINLVNASSGQQEMIPLSIILSFLPFVRFTAGKSVTVYIEEPEAHLFPNAQKLIVELISTIFNISPTKIQFFITTHSPYVITSFNNLLQAGNIYNKTNKESIKKQLYEIVPKNQILNYADLSVYSIEEGKQNLLMCNETNLISTTMIDKVSNDLAIQFDKILELE